ncbi:MAG TPA: MotA/TolQ/ExbB proton channel family protein [Rhodothermales bacterium]|nr:MotA/TolQ/ExbB proton channel family protein [Rhodothermales bacterium]
MSLLAQIMLLQQQAGGAGPINEIQLRFNEGGFYMWPILISFILGLAIAFERIVTLNLADIDARKFVARMRQALRDGGLTAAEEVCARTRGPVATILRAGLARHQEGIEAVEKAVLGYGSIEMAFLERGLVWLSLFISVAPLFGFLGTVVGMVEAFDAIERAGDISASLVARGIKIALLTTVFGLIAAITLQFFYNYAVSKIDRIVVDMEEASIELIDALVEHNGANALAAPASSMAPLAEHASGDTEPSRYSAPGPGIQADPFHST